MTFVFTGSLCIQLLRKTEKDGLYELYVYFQSDNGHHSVVLQILKRVWI